MSRRDSSDFADWILDLCEAIRRSPRRAAPRKPSDAILQLFCLLKVCIFMQWQSDGSPVFLDRPAAQARTLGRAAHDVEEKRL